MTLANIIGALGVLLDSNKLKSLSKIDFADENSIKGVSTLVINLQSLMNIFSTSGFTAGVKALGTSLAQGAGALIAAHPVITTLIAAFAAVKAVDAFVVDYGERLEKAQQSFSDYQNTVSELESVNSELETTKQQMNDLKAKGTLSLVEEDELERLERTNAQLETRAKILETLKEAELQDAKNDFNDYLNNTSSSDGLKDSLKNGLFIRTRVLLGLSDNSDTQMLVTGNRLSDAEKYHMGTVEATPFEALENHLDNIEKLKAEMVVK